MILAAIPARWGATRFPGKALAELGGRPVIARVVETALAAGRVDRVVVVTDHAGIGEVARAAGARVVVLDRPAASGTDRIGHLLEVDTEASRAAIVVNVQGDEPLLEPAAIDTVVDVLDAEPEADLATLVRLLREGEDPADPDLVKVAVTEGGRALYFSRAPIPYGAVDGVHVGLYAYRRAALERFLNLPPSALERAERLEQLRALEAGLTIACARYDTRSIGIDTPADLARAERALAAPF